MEKKSGPAEQGPLLETEPAVWRMPHAKAAHSRAKSGLTFRSWARSGVFKGKRVTGKLAQIVRGAS